MTPGKIYFDKHNVADMAGLGALIKSLNDGGVAYAIENGDDRYVEVIIYSN